MSELGNFYGDADAWRIKVVRGPFQGIKYYEVFVRSTGAYSGGETDGQWFGMGESRYDDRSGVALLTELVNDDSFYEVDNESLQVALDLLDYHGVN